MSNVYVISDLHLGHKNVAEWRGFNTVEEHDQYIIDKWNSVVGKRDYVKVLGDIAMHKKHYPMLDELNGKIDVILGNHDLKNHVPDLMMYVNSVCGMVKYKGVWLSHAPIHPQELRGHINIHGHVHMDSIDDDRYINVSCDVVDYTPQLISKYLK